MIKELKWGAYVLITITTVILTLIIIKAVFGTTPVINCSTSVLESNKYADGLSSQITEKLCDDGFAFTDSYYIYVYLKDKKETPKMVLYQWAGRYTPNPPKIFESQPGELRIVADRALVQESGPQEIGSLQIVYDYY